MLRTHETRGNLKGPHAGSFAAGDLPVPMFVDPLPRFPTMAATALRLELLLQETLVDLQAIAEVILSDAGATLQILRLIGEEFAEEGDRPTRIADCLVSLNSERWYEVTRQRSAAPNERLVAEWQRCRRVGECARELAVCFDGMSPDEAYVVGLLHRLGEFPHLLGWSEMGTTTVEHHALGLMLAEFWQLPRYLTSAIREQQAPCSPAVWGELLRLATQLAEAC